MNCNDFILVYWKHYISLEKELLECLNYVEIDSINLKAYSSCFSKMMLEICSEIDVVLKLYCKQLNPKFNGRSIDRYRENIFDYKNSFIYEKVKIYNKNLVLKPWIDWENNDINPSWWFVYNKIKHERTTKIKVDDIRMESYKFGNLENVLNSLAALYQILVFMYYDISLLENRKVNTPIPGSRLFQLDGDFGKTLSFYGNDAFYLDDGQLLWEHGLFYY